MATLLTVPKIPTTNKAVVPAVKKPIQSPFANLPALSIASRATQAAPTVKPPTTNVTIPHQNLAPTNNPLNIKGLGASIQQGAGEVADVALEGGGSLRALGTQTNPFTSQTTKNTQLVQDQQASQRLRSIIHNSTDITGNKIVGTSDVDKQATNIATGHGSAQDVAAVLGKSAEVGTDAASLINPGGIAKDAAGNVVKQGTSDILKLLAKQSATLGGAQGASTGLTTYGQTGNLGKALKAGSTSAVTSTVANAALGGLAHGAGKLVGNAAKTIAEDTNKQAGSLKLPENPAPKSSGEVPAKSQTGSKQEIPVSPQSKVVLPQGKATKVQGLKTNNVSLPQSSISTPGSQPKLNDNQIIKGFSDVRKQMGNDDSFYKDFVLKEADKPTRSADLAIQIIRDVESRGIHLKQALDEATKYSTSTYSQADLERDLTQARSESVGYELNSMKETLRSVEKTSGQTGLYKKVMKSIVDGDMNEQQAHDYIGNALSNMRGKPVAVPTKTTPNDQAFQDTFGTTETPAQIKAQVQSKLIASQKAATPKKIAANKKAMNANADKANERLTIDQMDAQNPVKVTIPEIDPNNSDAYSQARHQAQMASVPTTAATRVATYSAKRAGLTAGQLADRIEHPEDYPNPSKPVQQAIDDHKALTNRIAATSHALGGSETTLPNFFHHNVEIKTPEDKATIEKLTGQPYNPEDFRGINAMHRLTDKNGTVLFPDVRSLNKAGLHLTGEDKPASQYITRYGQSASHGLETQAIKKGITEADSLQEKHNRSVDFADGKPLSVSERGRKEMRAYTRKDSSAVGKIYDKGNSGLKHVLLSASQYHPVNVNLLTAAPALVLRGHPIRAIKGAIDTAATAISPRYSVSMLRKDIADGTVEKSAQIGHNIVGSSDFSANGKNAKINTGQMVFGRQIPAMARQIARGSLRDLKGEDLTTRQSRDVGKVDTNTMGLRNAKATNLNPTATNLSGKVLLAPQFELSKLGLIRSLVDPRTGANARYGAGSSLIGKYALEAGLGIAGGSSAVNAFKQAAIHPQIPTNQKDDKGNNIDYKLPDTGPSEIANLALKTSQDSSGKLHIGINSPTDIINNLKSDATGKLAPLASDANKLYNNINYAGKPLYQSNAPLGTQATQAVTTIAADHLPIGLQGLAYNKTIDNILPKDVSTILQANAPKGNPLVKSGLSAIGLTQQTDTTRGQGLQTQQYFDSLDEATNSLQGKAKAAFQQAFGSDKDPVTGAYLNTPSAQQTAAKYSALAAYPAALDAANKMNQVLKSEGQNVDPFFSLTPDQQKTYLTIHADTAPLDPNRTALENENSSWLPAFQKTQSDYYNSLPPADPNKPTNPIKYPDPSVAVQAVQTQYDKLFPTGSTDSAGKSSFLDAHPELIDQ